MTEYYPNKIREMFDQKITEDCQRDTIPEMLFHYTNSAGLIGILGTRKLWLTRVDCCNDPSERILAYELLRDRLLARSRSNPSLETMNDNTYYLSITLRFGFRG